MFMENGFRNALLDGTVAAIRRIDGQLVLINPQRYIFTEPLQFPRRRLEQAPGLRGRGLGQPALRRGVADALAEPVDGALAADPRARPIPPTTTCSPSTRSAASARRWERPDTALADVLSKERGIRPASPRA